MIRQQVSSSCIRSVGYDGLTSVLVIEFNSGSVYRYLGVPEHVYQGLMKASSKGTYFNNEIKDAYRYSKS